MPASDQPTVVIVRQEAPVVISRRDPPPVVQQSSPPIELSQTIVPSPPVLISECPPPSSGGDLHYRHQQTIPASTWVVVHGLGKYPSVTAADSAGSWVIGDVRYDSINQCTLIFAAAFSGQAFFN